MASTSELACVYSALILHDDGVPITVSDKNQMAEYFVKRQWTIVFLCGYDEINLWHMIIKGDYTFKLLSG